MAHGRKIIQVGDDRYAGKPGHKEDREPANNDEQQNPEFNDKLGYDPAIAFLGHERFLSSRLRIQSRKQYRNELCIVF